MSGRTVLSRLPDPDSDPKHAWELGRFQFALPLVQAWWITREPSWAEAYRDLVDSWIEANPFPLGVHWASAMEVGLRAFSWTHALWHLRDAPCLDEPFWRRWRASLRDHQRYIRLCLEWEILGNGNHYLADVLGLAVLAQGVPGLGSRGAGHRALARFTREVENQTLDDGANFEGSTAYHRFVTEIFVWAAATGLPFEEGYHRRIAAQLTHLDALCREDGSIARIGDDDGGRVLPLSRTSTRAVLDVGFALIPGAPRRKAGGEATADLIWAGGEEALGRWRSSSSAPARSHWRGFRSSGLYIREQAGWHVTVAAGPEKCRAGGGHLHSDLLSVVAHAAGCELLLDPGTLSYAGSKAARDSLRRACAHSTIALVDEEPRPLLEKFRTGPAATASASERGEWLDLEVRLAAGFLARRSIRLIAGEGIEIVDRVTADPPRRFELSFVLGPEPVERIDDELGAALFTQAPADGLLELRCQSSPPADFEVVPLRAARAYGVPMEANRVRIRPEAGADLRIHTILRFTPAPRAREGDLARRLSSG